MAKFMTNKELEPLQNKASTYDSIVAAILATNSNLKAEEVTAELIIEAITSNAGATDPELQSKFDTLQGQHNDLIVERNGLKEQVTNLLNSAAEDPAEISSDSEADAEPVSIADFANKNKGNTAAILEMAKKEGLI
ncbi:MAG: hypothetical protein E6772_16725 [Dysgonomonas sp.]|nr:hypothetical protein [Dysgonomonas sp.]